ncbi:MAG: YbaB/EbfC family nucleoid-associated protein [Kiritimatiellae bacterium]|nr:YbaB/EbfC family nucleoid-associated protein [Kiritimatiellia bacterium]
MGLLGDVKEMFQARSEVKRIQNEMAKVTAEYTNGGITAVARGDGSLVKISVAAGGYDEVKAGKPARFETMLLNVVNAAIKQAKVQVQERLSKTLDSEMSGLLG